ncbi:condensin subunit ScpA [Natranaerovirga pectinivora]|uniref:Segregation and condensation protein A n=1 Tax=Natranaerovirga pectinivora TaxID=682400 RepID=A0A4R3MLM9_9FIRM|nr:segregation/condensation protein A [Natranaerovirga pectinivora]TCT15014.1 condensin subunit ScpA [Natranaerovirga pectinivora]
MSISIKLQAFEGPLDLLLHLIEKNKVNIYDIPIVSITDQYLEYIKQMENKNLDIMSEFLVMAATLISIKSRMLLPKKEKMEEESEIDPREELVERLLEYKKYKFICGELKDKQIDAQKVIFKESTIPEEIKNYEEKIPVEKLMADIDLSKLYKIFKNVMRKQVDKVDLIRSNFGKIEREEFSINDKINYIKDLSKNIKKLSFHNLLEKTKSKQEIIATFLAILELIKIGAIHITQENNFDDIEITFVR